MVHPGGITQTDTYNDVTNTQTVSLLSAGAQPTSVTTDDYNSLNQPVSSSTTYPDGTPQAPAAETYDGLGRVTSYTADNVTATTSYAGAGGLQTGTTLTPTDTSDFPGADITAATGNTMTGALTTKTLTQAANPGRAEQRGGSSGRRHQLHLQRRRADRYRHRPGRAHHQLHLHPRRADCHPHPAGRRGHHLHRADPQDRAAG